MKKTGLFLNVIAILIWLGCSKTNSSPAPSSPTGPTGPTTPATPTITSLAPDSGVYNTTVTISGTNFNTNASMDVVTFNGVTAVVNSATATQLSVTVPKGAGTGVVKATVGSQTITGPVFNYVYTYTISTLAGGNQGDMDGTGTAAEFYMPFGIVVDNSGNVIVADAANNKIRSITPAGVVTTIAGVTGKSGYQDGPASSALFSIPTSVAIDAMGNILVADADNYKVREISTTGIVSTVAGTTQGEKDGSAATAQFDSPSELTVDVNGKIYVCDAHYIRVIDGGSVSTLYDGKNYTSTLNSFTAIVLQQNGNLALLDDFGANVFSLTPAGTFSVLAGNGLLAYLDGPALTADFSSAIGLAVDGAGNILVADEVNQRIRLLTPGGNVSTIAGINTGGDVDGPASTAELYYPHAIAVDRKSGNIYVAETMSNRIRKITVE